MVDWQQMALSKQHVGIVGDAQKHRHHGLQGVLRGVKRRVQQGAESGATMGGDLSISKGEDM